MAADPSPCTRGLRWSVRTRILAAMLLVTAIGMTAAGATAYLVQRDRILHQVDDRLLHTVESVRAVAVGPSGSSAPPEDAAPADEPTAEPTADPQPTGSPSAAPQSEAHATAPEPSGFASTEAVLEAALARVLPGSNESSLGIIDGRPRYITGAEVEFHLDDDPALVDRVVGEVSDGSVRIGTYSGELGHLRYIAVPVTLQGSPEEGIFVTAIDLDAELGQITTAFLTYTWVAIASLLAVGLVGWFVAGRLLRPIRSLRDTASRITGSDLSERIPVRGNDDVSALTATVNDMLQRIDDSLQAQGRLLDDVRHELKTPITIIHGHLELLDASSPDEVRETRSLVLDELNRMASLIDDIESLAASRDHSLNRADTDITVLVHQIFTKASAIPGHVWSLELPDATAPVRARVDADRLTQAILQLADNAAKHTPSGSPIVIGLTTAESVLQLWVADQGPGIPPDAQERIFERFGRADTGRGIQGSGLGLSIVSAIATAHRGSVTLTSSPLGSRFTLEIPVDPPEASA